MNPGRIAVAAALILGTAALASCGGSNAYSSGSPAASPSAAAAASPGASPAAAPAMVVASATATVAGKSEAVLTDNQAMTLYYRTPDTASSVGCTGSCATNWPPLLLTSGTPAGPSGVTGTLTTIDGPNGRQVEYNGHPLYRFASDGAAGDTKGEGLGGVWHVATPGLT
ncbi:MAG: hypothetical protein QOK05_427 [Chloroflexota bacterium]|jgi:predicted lipoprotein with Yx(FWY)xxD motif|nr:hypothetical protein [Chloroflexota bacterium]